MINTITLSEEEIIDNIGNYYGQGKNYSVYGESRVSIENDELNILFYLNEYMKCNGKHKIIKTLLTKDDLYNVFNNYLKDYNYELNDFKYIGEIKNNEYNRKTPYFDGVELYVKELENNKKLIKA